MFFWRFYERRIYVVHMQLEYISSLFENVFQIRSQMTTVNQSSKGKCIFLSLYYIKNNGISVSFE